MDAGVDDGHVDALTGVARAPRPVLAPVYAVVLASSWRRQRDRRRRAWSLAMAAAIAQGQSHPALRRSARAGEVEVSAAICGGAGRRSRGHRPNDPPATSITTSAVGSMCGAVWNRAVYGGPKGIPRGGVPASRRVCRVFRPYLRRPWPTSGPDHAEWRAKRLRRRSSVRRGTLSHRAAGQLASTTRAGARGGSRPAVLVAGQDAAVGQHSPRSTRVEQPSERSEALGVLAGETGPQAAGCDHWSRRPRPPRSRRNARPRARTVDGAPASGRGRPTSTGSQDLEGRDREPLEIAERG